MKRDELASHGSEAHAYLEKLIADGQAHFVPESVKGLTEGDFVHFGAGEVTGYEATATNIRITRVELDTDYTPPRGEYIVVKIGIPVGVKFGGKIGYVDQEFVALAKVGAGATVAFLNR